MSRWIEDPQGREEVEKVTRFLKLPVWKPQYLGKFREFWNELWEKIDTNAESSALTLSGKEDSFLKNTAFNKDFGVAREQVLEGAKLAEILGIQYGGLLNNNTTKKRGLGYYCTVNESIYKCKEDTQLNYAESNYFDAISNDDLLGKLQNLANNIDTGLGYLRVFNYIIISGKINLTNGTSTHVKYNHQTNGTIGVHLTASNPDCNYNKLTTVEESSLGFAIVHPNTYGTLAVNYTAVCFL